MQVKKGFTLIELSLSLVFIAVLSLTIAFIIINTVATYRRGITLKQINTTGMGVVDDMRAAIQNSSTKSVKDDCTTVYGSGVGIGADNARVDTCKNDGASNFVTLTKAADVEGKKVLRNVPVYGAFCTGTYTYIWNSGYFFNKDTAAYKVKGVGSAELRFNPGPNVNENTAICKKDSRGFMQCSGFRLLKVKDESRSVCITVAGSAYNVTNVPNVFDITGTSEIVGEDPIDLLASDENGIAGENGNGLALYNLTVSGPAESTSKGALFYAVSFVLGTIQGGANVTKSGNFCATPDEYETENFDYCSINKFNFAAEATGV